VAVTIASGGGPTQDVLSIHNAGIGSGQIGFDGTVVTYEGTPIGDVSGGDGTPLLVDLNATASVAAVSSLMGSITYQNLLAIPDITQRTVVFSVNDGDGTASGGTDTGTATATISFLQVNDPPTINNLQDDVLTYVEASGPQNIDQGLVASVVDPDSLDFNGGSLRVSVVSGAVPAEDELSISTSGNIALVGNDVQHSGATIGTLAGGTLGSDLVISFNSLATAAVVAGITYENMSTLPDLLSRTVVFTLNDGDGTESNGNDTTAVQQRGQAGHHQRQDRRCLSWARRLVVPVDRMVRS
jgi:hypothetical protein